MSDLDNVWYVSCLTCGWIAPLSTSYSDSGIGYCAPTDYCRVCDSELRLVEYSRYSYESHIRDSGEYRTGHGWDTILKPDSELYFTILALFQDQNDIDWWVK